MDKPRAEDHKESIASSNACLGSHSTPETGGKNGGASESNVIVFPEYAAVKEEIEKLRTELSMLILERDHLLYVVCKNIETAYLLALGALEYKAYAAECGYLRMKRKLELVQAKRNRQEPIILSELEAVLDAEFAEYQAKLNEQINKMNEAILYSKCRSLTDEEQQEMKKLYRHIVKALHPDLHPNESKARLQLFMNAVTAYESGDLLTLRVIFDMLGEEEPDVEDDALLKLTKERDRLQASVHALQEAIVKIKSEYPYTMKSLVDNQEYLAEKRAELKATIRQYHAATKTLKSRLDELVKQYE